MSSGATSSSSPTIWRMAMRPPVPMSTLPTKIVTEPSAWMARYESTRSGASGLPMNRSAPGTVERPQPLDGDDVLADRRLGRQRAGTDGAAADQHGAGAALGEAAAELGPRQSEVVAQDVEERDVEVGLLHLAVATVDPQRQL